MTKARSLTAGRERRAPIARGHSCGIPNAEALALIKTSGILNPDVRLDEIMRLSEQLGAEAAAKGHIFIFRNIVLVKCTF